MKPIIGLAVLIANIVATLDCLKSVHDTTKKILWLVLIWLAPGVGVIIYFLVGKKGS